MSAKLPNALSAYREAAYLGASRIGMVVLLYDRLVQDIYRGVTAMDAGDVEARTAHVTHALLILQQLQGSLDFEQGASVAKQLDAFYGVVRAKLLEAQIRQSRDTMLEQARAVTEIRECWAQLDSPPQIAATQSGTAPENYPALREDETLLASSIRA